jgi:hypothetical protein
MAKRTSQRIGADHERAVRSLLDQWSFRYFWKPRFRTSHGTSLEIDCLLQQTLDRPLVVLECKDFAVEAKNPEDSRRRKTQEALWLLIQLKRYCAETKGARLILITGPTGFRADQEALLKAELGEDFHIVKLTNATTLRQLIEAPSLTG